MDYHRREGMNGISTIVSTLVVVVIIALAAIIGATFLTSHNPGRATQTTTTPTLTTTSSTYSSSQSLTTSSSLTTLSTSDESSSSGSYTSVVNYGPSCFVLYSGAVHVFGSVSHAISGNIVSVKLYWSYHGQKNWLWLNDLTYGPSFSSNGNFSHQWNPPEAGYYDFEANWTLSNGQTITGITSQPFQVVAQGFSCP